MAIARKCDRCGELYEEYDHIECNGKEITGLYTAKTSEKGINFTQEHYDLCPKCCFDLAKWIVDPFTIVIRNDLADGIENFKKVETVIYDEVQINSIQDYEKYIEEETENGL